MRNLVVVFFILIGITVNSQQLNCTITVNSQQITNVNQQIFKTLQSSLTDFVNKTDWTGQVMKQNEKINCSIYINLTSGSSDQFSGTVQVQSSRPIFNSSYSSPVFNFNDKDFNFRYVEYENLFYNLGCNGIGILPSIAGSFRIAKLINNEVLEESIFDPK